MAVPDMNICYAYELGLIDYREAWELQVRLVRMRQQETIPDTLLLQEHLPVITQGRATKAENLLVPESTLKRMGFSLYNVERGGDITCHTPGQLVVYPIFDLKRHGQDLGLMLRKLEEVVIHTLACYNVRGTRRNGYTGVWVGDAKICAIGIAVKRWVSFHGLAFNLNPNLEHFDLIVPCGIRDHGVTSLARVLGVEIDFFQVQAQLLRVFGDVFDIEIRHGGGRESLKRLVSGAAFI